MEPDWDFYASLTPEEHRILEEDEKYRWSVGLPLQHREYLRDQFACEPEEIFSMTDAVNILLAGGGTA